MLLVKVRFRETANPASRATSGALETGGISAELGRLQNGRFGGRFRNSCPFGIALPLQTGGRTRLNQSLPD